MFKVMLLNENHYSLRYNAIQSGTGRCPGSHSEFHRGAIRGIHTSKVVFASHRFSGQPCFFSHDPTQWHLAANGAVFPRMEQIDRLKDTGLKMTLPRIKVLELFQRSERRHLTAEDVYRQMVELGMDLGLATVYRVLSQFEQAGILKKSQLGAGRAIYELCDGEPRHGHLVSLTDGQVHEFFDPQIEERLAAIARERGLEIADYVMTVFARPLSQP